jgi:hypothetical protein
MHSHGHTQLLLQHWQRLNSGPLMPPAVHFQRHFVSFSLISQNAPTARVSTVAKCPPQDERTKIMLARLKINGAEDPHQCLIDLPGLGETCLRNRGRESTRLLHWLA